jgi:O-Antigen ligase
VLFAIPIVIASAALLLFWLASNPTRLVFLLPLLLAFEYRVRFSSFSFDLSELSLFLVCLLYFVRQWHGAFHCELMASSSGRWLIPLLAICAFPAIFLEFNTAHAASVYRDLLLPFLFFAVFTQLRLEQRSIHTLIKLACLLTLANALLGIVQYATGNYLWFAGPEEAEWQAYKTGLAKLSIFGDWLAVQDTLPVGLYTGANMFGCFLSIPLCLTTALAFSEALPKWKRRASFLASMVILVCLLFTMFRSALLVYVASMLAIYLCLGRQRRVSRVLVVGVLATFVGALFLAQGVFDWDQFGSFEGRQEMISAALALIKAHPELLVTGGYTDLYHLQSKQTQEIHNLALYSIVQFGLPVTALFFAFFVGLIRRAWRAARVAHGIDRSLLIAIVASISANVFIYGASTMLIDSVQTSLWLLFWAGIANYLVGFASTENLPETFSRTAQHTLFPAYGDCS